MKRQRARLVMGQVARQMVVIKVIKAVFIALNAPDVNVLSNLAIS